LARTKLSSKGQVIIPKALRTALGLEAGMEFLVERQGGDVVLRPRTPFPPTTVEQAFGFLKYNGPRRSIEEMNAGVLEEAKRRWLRKSGGRRRS
jgi:AbrB family looped-hinge helix DNA binding protein